MKKAKFYSWPPLVGAIIFNLMLISCVNDNTEVRPINKYTKNRECDSILSINNGLWKIIKMNQRTIIELEEERFKMQQQRDDLSRNNLFQNSKKILINVKVE